jgi:hypothetical protein
MTPSLKYGITAGLALSVYTLLLFLMGLDKSSALGFVTYVILLSAMVLSVKEIRDNELNGYITFGNAWRKGMGIAFYSGIVYGMFMFIHLTYINEGYIEDMLLQVEETYEELGMSSTQIEDSMKVIRIFYKPGFLSIGALIGNLFMGLLLSLIPALIFKKEAIEELE